MNKNYKCILICLIVFTLLHISPMVFFAKNNNNSSMAIILAIDSSGSMLKTDPNKLRKDSAQLFVELLTTNDDISIIEFSSDIKVIQQMTTIRSYKDIKSIQEKLNNLTPAGNTRIDLALEEALKEFKNTSNQNKALILLSDGALDVDGSPTSTKSREALEHILSKTLKTYKKENITIYPITLSDKSASPASQKLQEKLMINLAKETNGFYSIAPSAADLHKSFIEIIKDLINPPLLLLIKEKDHLKFQIDNNIKRVNIIIDKKNSPESKITLNSPTETYTDSKEATIKWSKSSLLEIITLIEKPENGVWKIFSSKNIKKLDIDVFADTDFKLKLYPIENKVKAGKKIIISANLLNKMRNDEPFKKIPLPKEVNILSQITTPKGHQIILPLNHYQKGAYKASYIPVLPGKYQIKAFSEGKIERETTSIKIEVLPPPADEPKIQLDQNVYSIGETIKVSVFLKDEKIKFPEKTILLNSSDTNKSLKTSIKGKIIHSIYKIKKDSLPGEYVFTFEYYDSKGKIKQIEAIAYVIGKIELTNNQLDFGKLTKEGTAKQTLKINSELKLTTLPLIIEINKVHFDSKDFKNSDLRFGYKTNILIKGSQYSDTLRLSLPYTIFKKLQNPVFNNTYNGSINLIIYSKENEVLSEKTIPIKFTVGSYLEYNLLLIAGLMVLLCSIIGSFILLKKKKTQKKSKDI